MRVGIFISGEIRHDENIIKTNIDLLQDAFQCEVVFGAWKHQHSKYTNLLKTLPNVNYFAVPDIHYEPYIDNPDAISDYQYQKKLRSPNPRHKHQTKQMLVHNELMKLYGNQYDVIVRARWDTTISPIVNLMQYAYKAYREERVVTIGTRKDYHDTIHSIGIEASNSDPYLPHRDSKGRVSVTRTCEMLLDSGLVIHRTKDWDCDFVDQLHNDSKLLAAEFGWYQILVENTESGKWSHYDGGASLTRSINHEDREKLNEIICNYY